MKSEEKGLIKYSVTIGIIVFVVLCVTHNLNIRLNTLKSITDYAGDSISISVTFAFFMKNIFGVGIHLKNIRDLLKNILVILFQPLMIKKEHSN